MQVAKLMRQHVKWQDDGPIESKEFPTTKQIFFSPLVTFGVVRSLLLVLVMTQPDILSLVPSHKDSNYSSIMMYPTLKGV